MARFYDPPNPTGDPNYLNVSREPSPQKADTSMGELFKDIGGLVNLTGKAAKDGFAEAIKRDAHDLIDPIQDQHGSNLTPEEVVPIAGTGAKGRVRAAAMRQGTGFFDQDAANNGTSPTPYAEEDRGDPTAGGIFNIKDDPKPLPPGASREISQLNRMTNAYRAGALSDSYYNAQLVSVTKELRARYPGFRDEVDAAVSGITGVQPANALRRSLLSDIYANQAAMLTSQTSEQKYRETNAGVINALGYDDKTPIETVRAGVNEWKGQKAILEAKALRANVGSDEAQAALSDTIAATVRSSITSMGNKSQGGMSLQDFQKQAQEMTARGGGTAQEIQQFVSGLTLQRNQLEQRIRAEVYQPITGRKDGHNLVTLVKDGDSKLAGIIQTQLKPYDDLIALAEKKQFSALERQINMIKEQGNIDLQNLYRAFPQARVAGAINAAFPNNPLMSNRFLQDSDIMPNWQKASKTAIGNAILGGTDQTPAPTPTQALQGYGPNASKSGAPAKATLNQYDIVISKDNANTENAVHVAKKFFTDMKFYDDMSDKARLRLFMTMASPAKTAYIKTLSAQDPEVGTAYENWAKYAARDIFSRKSQDLQSLITSKNVDIQFDPVSMQFVDNTRYGKDFAGNSLAPRAVQENIAAVNNAIMLLKPIVGEGQDAALKIVNALGINPTAAKEDGLMTRILNAIGDKFKENPTDRNNQDIQSGRQKLGRVSLDQPEAAALREVTGQAESGGNYNAVFGMGKDQERDLGQFTVGEIMALQKNYIDRGSASSAVGKYQFLRKTLAGLVKEGVVDADEKFTPDIQEALFTALAKRRGLDDFTSGKIDEATFANNLSQEWAGLPTTNGMSFYAGDGLNKSNAKLPKVLAALRKLRAGQDG